MLKKGGGEYNQNNSNNMQPFDHKKFTDYTAVIPELWARYLIL